jgi:hypothetical protein
MKIVATFAAVSLLALSGSVLAEQELSLSEMDGVTAGLSSASALAGAAAAGGLINTAGTAVGAVAVQGLSTMVSGSEAASIGLFSAGGAAAGTTAAATGSFITVTEGVSGALASPAGGSSGAGSTAVGVGFFASAASASAATAIKLP